ncbi:hypothetical protein scyTo_0025208 [Scyliorhinus torazame]|uniref:Uncharacterized protein n=1 Tax=Scyliorhinus torazame TaxID=75743 RepID=A0A401QGB7_SCYTO|nr:hypothetical protein [Scyliorhinus torazame]
MDASVQGYAGKKVPCKERWVQAVLPSEELVEEGDEYNQWSSRKPAMEQAYQQKERNAHEAMQRLRRRLEEKEVVANGLPKELEEGLQAHKEDLEKYEVEKEKWCGRIPIVESLCVKMRSPYADRLWTACPRVPWR